MDIEGGHSRFASASPMALMVALEPWSRIGNLALEEKPNELPSLSANARPSPVHPSATRPLCS